ncbi:uncharacterized protein [Rutidosis leptorrhynchoides]|uniref:uncharacterized protein n=1 Tax=Rutidosis leptorrhynchoides TaxID=125765 RepID=UPI003A99FAB1
MPPGKKRPRKANEQTPEAESSGEPSIFHSRHEAEDEIPENRHPNLQFARSLLCYPTYMKNLAILMKKEVEAPKIIDWEPLRIVFLEEPIRDMLRQSYVCPSIQPKYVYNDWVHLFELDKPIYMEWCMEFFSTVEMNCNPKDSDDDSFLRFCLGGQDQSMSMFALAKALGIYSPEELVVPYFRTYLQHGKRISTDFDKNTAWVNLSRIRKFKAGIFSYLKIGSRYLRIIQRFISHTITQRGTNTEKVSIPDLFLLMCFRDKLNVNIPYCMAKYLCTTAGGLRSESPMCGGVFITLIGQHLRVNLHTGRVI